MKTIAPWNAFKTRRSKIAMRQARSTRRLPVEYPYFALPKKTKAAQVTRHHSLAGILQGPILSTGKAERKEFLALLRGLSLLTPTV
jgi:hypothetical protein